MKWPGIAARPAAVLFCLAFATYAYFYQAGGWNQNSRFDLVRAIVERGTSRIDAYHENTLDKSLRAGHYYCDKAPGASWLAVPPYALLHAARGGAQPGPETLARGSYLATVFAVGLPSALAVALLFGLLCAMGTSRPAAAMFAVGYGLGTLAFPYATLFYGHQLVGALLLIGFVLLARARLSGVAPPSRARLAVVGAVLGYAVVVEYPAALAVAVLIGYAAWFVRPWSRLLWVATGLFGPAVALVSYHALAFGGPLTLPYEFSVQQHRHMGIFMGLGAPQADALWGILFGSYRGLFYSAPWLVCALPGAWLLARRRLGAEALVCIVTSFLFVWLNASLVDWQGGWTLGPRYLVPALPFLAIAAAGVALAWPPAWTGWRLRAAQAGLVAAVGLSIFIMLAGTAVKPEVPSHIRRPFSQYVLPSFYAADLAHSTQSIDSLGAPPDGPAQAWNLGELCGLDGLIELAPLLALWALAAGWLAFRRRARKSPRSQQGTSCGHGQARVPGSFGAGQDLLSERRAPSDDRMPP